MFVEYQRIIKEVMNKVCCFGDDIEKGNDVDDIS